MQSIPPRGSDRRCIVVTSSYSIWKPGRFTSTCVSGTVFSVELGSTLQSQLLWVFAKMVEWQLLPFRGSDSFLASLKNLLGGTRYYLKINQGRFKKTILESVACWAEQESDFISTFPLARGHFTWITYTTLPSSPAKQSQNNCPSLNYTCQLSPLPLRYCFMLILLKNKG